MTEIKGRKILIFLSIIIVCIACFQKCSFYTQNNVTVLNQQIIYDSINYKGKDFKISLYATLEFKKSKIKRNEYNDFLLIVKKDTFALVPELNSLEKNTHNNSIKIKYFSQMNFKSKGYDNDSINNIIKESSKIINSKGEEIIRNESYNIESLIFLHLPKNNGVKF